MDFYGLAAASVTNFMIKVDEKVPFATDSKFKHINTRLWHRIRVRFCPGIYRCSRTR